MGIRFGKDIKISKKILAIEKKLKVKLEKTRPISEIKSAIEETGLSTKESSKEIKSDISRDEIPNISNEKIQDNEGEVNIPSEDEIKKELGKINKKHQKNMDSDEESINIKIIKNFLLFIAISILLLAILSLEPLWDSITIVDIPADLSSKFMLDSCSAFKFPECSLYIYEDDAVIELELGENVLNNVTFPPCKDFDIAIDNTLYLHNCSFSSFYNHIRFTFEYQNPNTNLIHRQEGRIMKIYEITSFNYVSSAFFKKFIFFNSNKTK
ncbi:MAG: hypothetical protein KAK00_09825 [Nanoarchaeota archaeon]|nr:hypothetical protein [Nanoarchaeota archaeon]